MESWQEEPECDSARSKTNAVPKWMVGETKDFVLDVLSQVKKEELNVSSENK